MSIRIVIPGKPFAKQRHRMAAFGGRARAFNTKANETFEAIVREYAAQAFRQPLDGPVSIRVHAVFAPAASWSRKRRDAALGQWHTQKPDGDNVLKAVKDGLNRVAWADDAQVADSRVAKVWGAEAMTVIEIEALAPRGQE